MAKTANLGHVSHTWSILLFDTRTTERRPPFFGVQHFRNTEFGTIFFVQSIDLLALVRLPPRGASKLSSLALLLIDSRRPVASRFPVSRETAKRTRRSFQQQPIQRVLRRNFRIRAEKLFGKWNNTGKLMAIMRSSSGRMVLHFPGNGEPFLSSSIHTAFARLFFASVGNRERERENPERNGRCPKEH